MSALEKLRRWFLGRSRREQFLGAIFLAALGLTWTWSLLGRARAGVRDLGTASTAIEADDLWLNGTVEIEGRYRAAMARLQGESERPSKNEVLARIQELADKHGLKKNIPAPISQQRDPLTFHVFNLSIEKADYYKLRAFHIELTQRMPTVSLEQITLSADKRNDALIDARFKLVAVEFNR